MTDETLYEVVSNGRRYGPDTQDNLLALGADPLHISEAVAIRAAEMKRQDIRRAIEVRVGDTASILGTNSDVTQLNVTVLSVLLCALTDETSYAGFRTAVLARLDTLFPEDANGEGLVDQAETFLSGLESGEIKLTPVLKGLETVFDEMAVRATDVSEVLVEAGSSDI